MAKTGEKTRKTALGGALIPVSGPDPGSRWVKKQIKSHDKKIQEKGGFFESNIAQAGEEAKEAQRKQEAAIGRQRQRETLRLEEAESDVKRRRFLAKAGGRRSLIASR